jgi:glycosyltransferase involved in cell wall biosynthesis
MKILQVTNSYLPHLGGLEQHVQIISEFLVSLGHEVTVVTVSNNREMPTREEINGVNVFRFYSWGPQGYELPFQLPKFFAQVCNQYDLVHAHNYGGLPLLLAVHVFKGRTIVSPHYHGQVKIPISAILHTFYDPFAKQVLKQAGRFVCNSNAEADQFSSCLELPRENIKVIPSLFFLSESVDLNKKQSLFQESGQILLLSVGRLVKYKRVDRTIRAMPYLPKNFELVIVGKGPDQERLQRLAGQLGVKERVKFLGFVSDEILVELYHRCRVLVTLSEYESFGRTVIEGLSYHCKVLCSDIPAFTDFADEFPQMVKVIANVAGSRELADEVIGLAKQTVEKAEIGRFQADQVIPDLLIEYQRMANVAAIQQ